MPFVRPDHVETKIAWNQKMQCYGLRNTKLRRRERGNTAVIARIGLMPSSEKRERKKQSPRRMQKAKKKVNSRVHVP